MRKEGNNPYNNKVYVDYDDKTIRFIPVGKKSIRKYYFIFLTGIFGFYMICFMLPVIYGLAIIGSLLHFTDQTIFTLIIFSISQFVLMTVYFSLWYFRKAWRKKCFPELNYKLCANMFFGIKRLGKTKIKEINQESLINNKIIIPYFNNIIMEYKAKKDFGKQLKSIKIINIFKADPFKFFCVFEFRKKPKDGSLWVKYI